VIENAAALNRSQVMYVRFIALCYDVLTSISVSFFNIAIALVRFSKFYRFQGRLDILNKTIIYAFENL
jgi:hypothetical protein